MRWQLRAVGRPTPKGSWNPVPCGRPLVAGGVRHYRMRDIRLKPVDPPALAKWNHALALAALEAGRPKEPFQGPVGMDIVLWLARPKKPRCVHPITRRGGDVDKHQRTIFDCFTGVYYVDDSQVVEGTFAKRYCTAADPEGASITIYTIEVGQTGIDWDEAEEVLG